MSGGQPNIVVRITSNVREFVSGTKQVDKAFKDMARESDTLARDVETDTERMERAFRDAGRGIEQTTKKAGKQAARNLGDGARVGAKDAGKETAAEFASNLSESLSSGDLSAIGQDTAAGLVAGFVGMGGLVGAGLATAAIPIASFFGNVRKNAEQTKQRVTEVFGALKESAGELSESFLAARFDAVFSEDPEKWAKLSRTLKDAGLSAGTIRDAIAGTPEAAERVRKVMQEQDDIANRLGKTLNDPKTSNAEQERVGRAYDIASAQAKAAREVLKQNGYLETGITTYETYNELAARGLEGEVARTKELRKQLETLKLLNAEVTKGSPAQARIAAEAGSIRETLAGYGRRAP